MYAGYYVAELLGDGTQEYDPHPVLFEQSLDTLRKLAAGGDVAGLVSAYELGWLGELGLRPVLERCAACQMDRLAAGPLMFSPIAGGVVCPTCAATQRDRRSMSRQALATLEELSAGELPPVTNEVRQLLGHYVSTVLAAAGHGCWDIWGDRATVPMRSGRTIFRWMAFGTARPCWPAVRTSHSSRSNSAKARSGPLTEPVTQK